MPPIRAPIKRIFNASDTRDRRSVVAAGLVLGSAAAWLLVAAAIVDIEYYDGFSAICNARYFLGRSSFYLADRGPLMAWLLMPAELVKDWLGLHPLEVRPHHATMAVLHVGYLLAVYGALLRQLGQRWSTVIAFGTAITSYVFASYAPFISHDLLAGALFLWMLIWSEHVAQTPRLRPWLLLVAAGTLAPLVKQTFGVFWIAVLAAHVVPTLLRADPRHRTSPRALGWLAGGAIASGLLTWVIYGIVLANWAPQIPLWLRPYRNLQFLAAVNEGTDIQMPLWIYVRNLWAYGRLTTLLLIPGLALAVGGSSRQRRLALAWITGVVFIHVLPLREVRYMAFLAPLSAVVIAPALQMVGRRRAGVVLVAVLLLFDVSGAAREASKVATAFYRHSELRAFLEPLSDGARPRRPLLGNIPMLSFVSPDPSPLAADRYHHIFHMGIGHIGVLYGYAAQDVRLLRPHEVTAAMATAPEGSVLLFSTGILAHGPTWMAAPVPGRASFLQGLATAQTIVLRARHDGVYETSTGATTRIEAQQQGGHRRLIIDDIGTEATRLGYLVPVLISAPSRVYRLDRMPGGKLVLPDAPGDSSALPASLTIRFFAIQRRSAPPPLRP
jgi:hypothetical protein